MSQGLHPAVAGFDRAAEVYERGRPGYPPEALAYLRDALRVRTGDRILELGAGTGKFTRAMRPWSARRIAVEPVPGMRAVFRRASGDAELLIARAESIPVRNGAMDAVVAAQSFHWFRQPETLREILRVLRPGGGLGLVWNRRDESVPWVKELGVLIDAEAGDIPRTRSESWRAAFEEANGFGTIETRSFEHIDHQTREAAVDRVLSISAISLLDADRQRALAQRVRETLPRDGGTAGPAEIEFPYRAEVYVVQRSDAVESRPLAQSSPTSAGGPSLRGEKDGLQ